MLVPWQTAGQQEHQVRCSGKPQDTGNIKLAACVAISAQSAFLGRPPSSNKPPLAWKSKSQRRTMSLIDLSM